MAMSKRDFIALADTIRTHNARSESLDPFQVFTVEQLETLAEFCASQNPAFMRERWLGYIAETSGPNGQTNIPGERIRT